MHSHQQVEAVHSLLQVDNIKPVVNRNTDLDNVYYLGSTIVLKKYTGPNEVNGSTTLMMPSNWGGRIPVRLNGLHNRIDRSS